MRYKLIVVAVVCSLLGCNITTSNDPGPAPQPTPVPNGDMVDINSVVFHDPSPAGYEITATLQNVTISGGTTGPVTVCWDWSRPSWPINPNLKAGEKPVDGNISICAKFQDGKVHCGTWEMTAPKYGTHVCRTTEAHPGEPPMIQGSGFASWVPQPGETVWHIISTRTRGGVPSWSSNERTPIIAGKWSQ